MRHTSPNIQLLALKLIPEQSPHFSKDNGIIRQLTKDTVSRLLELVTTSSVTSSLMAKESGGHGPPLPSSSHLPDLPLLPPHQPPTSLTLGVGAVERELLGSENFTRN